MAKDNSTDSYTPDEVPSPNFFCTDFYKKRKRGKYRLEFAPSTKYEVADTHCHIEMFENPEWTFIRSALHNVAFLACVIDSTDDGPEGIKKVEDAYCKAQEMLPDIIKQIKQEGFQSEDRVIIQGDSEKPAFCLDVNAIVDNPKLPEFRYIIGTHPHYAKDFDAKAEENLIEMLKNPKVSCVGEIGLDYHYDLSPRETQVEVFKKQLKIAEELGFPVSLHLREAHDDAIKVFDELGFNSHGTLLHCFNLGSNELKPWVDAGCYVALGGPITFKNSDDTRCSVDMIPSDKLLTETDAPFMTPEPLRGDICFPDHVIFNAKTLFENYSHIENEQMFYNQIFSNAKSLLDRELLSHQK